jgi:hypothetical protein
MANFGKPGIGSVTSSRQQVMLLAVDGDVRTAR